MKKNFYYRSSSSGSKDNKIERRAIKSQSIHYIKVASRQKKQQSQKSLKICVYTCITGSYDNLKEPIATEPNIDYVLFTDNISMFEREKIWRVKSIPEELSHLDKVRQQRLIKILSHKFLPEYDLVLWIDGRIQIVKEISKFIQKTISASQKDTFL